MPEFELKSFKILTTGSDGGHYYVSTEIKFKGKLRKLIIIFSDKEIEKKIFGKNKINVKGEILDEGENLDLMMLEAKIF